MPLRPLFFLLTLSIEIFLLVRYDGDSTIGHRLYSEYVTLDFKRNLKGKNGRLTKPVINIQWETVATNLDEFVEISEKLCSKGRPESAIGEHLKTEIIPDVEKLQKVAFSSRAFYSVASIFPQGCPIHECIYILLWNQDLCLAARYEAHTLLL
jgi:hypothetical protein